MKMRALKSRGIVNAVRAIMMALLLMVGYGLPALATSQPDSTPTILAKYAYRNLLETGDFLLVVDENTPYATVPTDYTYPQAYVWRLLKNDGVTEVAQALGYTFNDYGYGYNVISFYMSASNFTASGITYGDVLQLKLSQSPVAFTTPNSWTYQVNEADYSDLTATADVKAALASQILSLAATYNARWGLSGTTSLISDSEIGQTLSIYGEAFFRGAIKGAQSLAPNAFDVIINNINTTGRNFTDNYSSQLAAQMTGTPLDTANTAGNALLGVDYNLFGLVLVLGMIIVLFIANWMIGGGNLWRGAIDAGGILVISARLSLIGLGEVGLVAAICWIYISARFWRYI